MWKTKKKELYTPSEVFQINAPAPWPLRLNAAITIIIFITITNIIKAGELASKQS